MCGKLLHCLQQGILEYALTQLFKLKKESKRKIQIECSNVKKKGKRKLAGTDEESGDESSGSDLEEDK